jgi:hypothetical protein
MIAKCANPICGAHFRYLNQGRIYNVPVYPPDSGPQAQSKVGPQRVEHFWLCSVCCVTLTLVLRNGKPEVQARYPLLTQGGEAPQEPAVLKTRPAAA